MLRQVTPKQIEVLAPQDAILFFARMREHMASLRLVLEAETAFITNNAIRETAELQVKKTELSLNYIADFDVLKANLDTLREAAPQEFESLRQDHDILQSVLAENLGVLATAQAVSEGLVRGVARQMEAKQRPQTYSASGRIPSATHGTARPVSVSRSL